MTLQTVSSAPMVMKDRAAGAAPEGLLRMGGIAISPSARDSSNEEFAPSPRHRVSGAPANDSPVAPSHGSDQHTISPVGRGDSPFSFGSKSRTNALDVVGARQRVVRTPVESGARLRLDDLQGALEGGGDLIGVLA